MSSFWNLAAPAVALALLAIGFFVWGLSKQRGASRVGTGILAVGLLAFVVAAGVDVSRNAHDANELETAAHARYGVTLDFADAAALFDSSDITKATVDGQRVREYGKTSITDGNKTVGAFLDERTDGTFLLATRSQELPLTR